jgi:hypothetical protein
MVKVDKLKIAELLPGKVIMLFNENKDFSKGSLGKAEQVLKYIGNNQFEVMRSTRSLEPGMIIETREKIWKPEMELSFKVVHIKGVERSNPKLRSLFFEMRPLKKMIIN